MTTEFSYPLNTDHPNYSRWKRGIENSVERGRLVCSLLSEFLPLKDCVVLDAGCGVGGTSIALHEIGTDVIAYDRNPSRIEALQQHQLDIDYELGSLEELPFPDGSFDCIILQDVIEHLPDPFRVLSEAYRTLLPQGILYISTPNKQSLINVVSDPHWGLPFASLKTRNELRAFLASRRPDDANRDDLAQLFSLSELLNLLASVRFEPVLLQPKVVDVLFSEPNKVVWSDLHLKAVRFLKNAGLEGIVRTLVNDRPGFVNTWLSPTWYMVCRKADE